MRFASWVKVAVLAALLVAMTPALASADVLTYARVAGTGSPGTGAGQFDYPHDVAGNQWGETWVADSDNGRLQLFNPAMGFVRIVGAPGVGQGQFGQIRSVACDRWGTVYAVDGGSNRVEVFTRGGFFTREFEHPLFTYAANGIAVALDGTIYVSSTSGNQGRIARFDPFGALLGSWNTTGAVMGIAVSQDGDIYAAMDEATAGIPNGSNKIVRYSALGQTLGSWGATGTADGEFDRPFDLDVDGAGRVFVVDTGNSRVQAFSSTGEHLSTFGAPGSGPQELSSPLGLSAGYDRRVLIADTSNSRFSAWEAAPAASTSTTEIAGATRIETAVQASKRAYPSRVGVVVVATAANWPDALGGAALAGVAKGPLLLTNATDVPDALEAEVLRLAPQKIYVLGGTGVISSEVQEDLRDLTITGDCERLGGADRYATANQIAAETIQRRGTLFDGTAFVVTGVDFPDALAASPVAAANGWPIFLTPPQALPLAVENAMLDNNVTHGYIMGGAGAVSSNTANRLQEMLPPPPEPGIRWFTRIAGVNRYSTSALLAEWAIEGLGMIVSRPAIATGQNFPDALAGGVLQGSDYCPLLLTPSASLNASAAAVLSGHRNEIYELRFLGGTGAVSPAVRTAARELLP